MQIWNRNTNECWRRNGRNAWNRNILWYRCRISFSWNDTSYDSMGRRCYTSLWRGSVVARNGKWHDSWWTRIFTFKQRCKWIVPWILTSMESSARITRLTCNVNICTFSSSWTFAWTFSFKSTICTNKSKLGTIITCITRI